MLPLPTSFTPDIISYAKKALLQIYKPNLLYKKAGIILAQFTSETLIEQDLFQKSPIEKNKKIMQTISQINKHYGNHTVYFAAEGTKAKWKKKPINRSPRYTTKWDDIPIASVQ